MKLIHISTLLIGASAKSSSLRRNANRDSSRRSMIATSRPIQQLKLKLLTAHDRRSKEKLRDLQRDFDVDEPSVSSLFEDVPDRSELPGPAWKTCGGRCPVDTDVGAELCTSFLDEFDHEPHCNAGCIPDSELSSCQLFCGDDSVANNVGAADSSSGISITTITAEQKKRDMWDDLVCGECKFFECCVSNEATISDTKYETCKGLQPLGGLDISGDPSCGEKCSSTDNGAELCTSFMETIDIKPHCDAGCIPESDLLVCDSLCSDYVAAPVAAAPDTVITAPQKKRDIWEDVVCGECRYYQCCVSDEETCEEPDIESLLPDIDSLIEDLESLFPDDVPR